MAAAGAGRRASEVGPQGRLPIGVDWYSLLAGVRSPEAALRDTPLVRRLPPGLVRALWRRPATRGLLLFAASTVHPTVAIQREAPGWAMLLLLRALFGRRRKLIVLQHILHQRRHPLRRFLAAYDRWATRRTLLRSHALSRADLASLVVEYGLPSERFAYVPWPLAFDPPPAPPPAAEQPLVLCAGRAYCDWETLLDAAAGAGWPLVLVCGSTDRRRVEQLNQRVGAELLSELPRDEFFSLLERATVSVVPLQEKRTTAGHIRIQDARTHAVPLVVSAIDSVADYVRDEDTALVVPPGDPAALRAAVDRLLADGDLRERLRVTAYLDGLRWQTTHYFAALADLVHGRPVELPPAAPGAVSPS